MIFVRLFGWLTKARPGCKRHDWCQFKGQFVCSVCERKLR